MTEEQKKAETARLEAEAKAREEADAEFEAGLEGLSDEEKAEKIAEKEAKNTDNTTDYKALALKEKEAREKAEKALAEKRFIDANRKRKAKEDGEDDNDDEDEDKPITSRDLQRILAENSQQTEKRLMAVQIKDIATDLADSPEEAEAIIEIHANRTFPAHLPLSEQLEEAYAIANRKKLISTNSELKRALKSKRTASKDSAGTHRDPMEGTAPRMSAGDTAAYKRAGFTFDTKDGLWKRKLPSGKFLIKNPKTKQTYTA